MNNIDISFTKPSSNLSTPDINIANKSVEAEKEKVTLAVSTEDKVSISEEGKSKSMEDTNRDALRKLMGTEEKEEVKKTEEEKLEEKIAELQKKSMELMQQISELAMQKDEAAQNKRDLLEAELAVVNAQLMELLNQKLNGAKKTG